MPVNGDFLGARQAARPERHKGTNPQDSENHPEGSTRKSQHGAFRETLAKQPAPPCSESRAHSDFALAGNGTGQKQAGNIRACDQ